MYKYVGNAKRKSLFPQKIHGILHFPEIKYFCLMKLSNKLVKDKRTQTSFIF